MSQETEQQTLEGGNYEVIRKRLVAAADALRSKAEGLNHERQETFGGTELLVVGNERIRTEHNCVPRDIINVGGRLLFGYNVFIGLKKTTGINDVFSLNTFAHTEAGDEISTVDPDTVGFLTDRGFQKEFAELYSYYDGAKLQMLRKIDGKLLAVFQIGRSLTDVKVFRWALDPSGRCTYIDNRGERDHTFPQSHDFEWVHASQDDHITGRHPHISILDEVFVETVGGDLTIKIEDNTESGQGIYAEPVEDASQSLSDASVAYTKVGTLILMRIRPFGETDNRYLVFDTRNQQVVRIDAIGQACVQLPEDHGIMFPGGYYLQTGDYKVFDQPIDNLIFERQIRSPNGEDVMFVFHEIDSGNYSLYPYNLIRKEVQNPIHCHGFTLFEDGRLVLFRSASDEPTRVHPIQVWQTPFISDEVAAAAPKVDSFLGKIGNAELVRGISDAYTVLKVVDNPNPNQHTYEDLIKHCTRMLDAYHWLGAPDVDDLKAALEHIRNTTELIVDEFEKVLVLRRQATVALQEARTTCDQLFDSLVHVGDFESVQRFMEALTELRGQRGHLITLREVRYIDLEALDSLEARTVEAFERTSQACVSFLLGPDALAPLTEQLDDLLGKIENADKGTVIRELEDQLSSVSEGLNVLSEVIASLDVDDPTQRTAILEGLSEVFSHNNRVRAVLETQKKALFSHEAKAEFAVQIRLLAQSVAGAVSLADSPEKCDEQLSRLLVQLEELESKFGESDEYANELLTKREEITDALSTKKQTLLDARQRRAENLFNSAERIIGSAERRAKTFAEVDQLNSYFAADPMVLKLRQIAEELAELGDSVRADEVLSKLKRTQQDALRGLRDRQDLFSDGDNLITLGHHQFSVNTQDLELTLVPRDGAMAVHLTGTGFYEGVDDDTFNQTREYWQQTSISENPAVARAEYLAASMLFDAEAGKEGLTIALLHQHALSEEAMLQQVRAYASERYEEGYERGVHDVDAARILLALLSLRQGAGLLRFGSVARGVANLFWYEWEGTQEERAALEAQALSLGRLRQSFETSPAIRNLGERLATLIQRWLEADPTHPLCGRFDHPEVLQRAGAYLAEQLMSAGDHWLLSGDADTLQQSLRAHLEASTTRVAFEEDIKALDGHAASRLRVSLAWYEALIEAQPELPGHALLEAAVATVTKLSFEPSHARTTAMVEGLLSQHSRIESRNMTLRLDEFLDRLRGYHQTVVPGFRAYKESRHALLVAERERLRIDEFQPRVMSAFVRNRLINEVYLPMIGDNLAKQIGAAGAAKRTDLMGLLLLISPPGYGKTTLMEYVANRLGLVFMKVNGPSLGHEVHSLDPAEAPNATARQEVDKINLALEMGNNVMLYLDDIQHTHPELLQKFISLCDATRRIEGVWKGKTRTYDLRGKKFCVVMAGNPYTESGDKFQIPDMLANRADTYNLGDILEGRDEVFALSYVENAITSNPVLAPLAGRDQQDIYKLADLARGREVATTDLSHGYSGVEISEITNVLKQMFTIREVLLKVNAEYIRSASMDDSYRTEPRFQLQGSYRNMNKMAEKVMAAMNDAEVAAVIADHYLSEAQTLTTGAEANLLKLAELRGLLDEEQAQRWGAIKKDFARIKMMGGGDDDPITRVTGTLAVLGQEMEGIRSALNAVDVGDAMAAATSQLSAISKTLGKPTMEPQLTALTDELQGIRGAVEATSMKEDLTMVAKQLAALRSGVAQGVKKMQAPPSKEATKAPEDWLVPSLELSTEADLILRHAVLLHVQRALVAANRVQSGAHQQLETGDLIISSTLPVMQALTQEVTNLVNEHVPAKRREPFMEELRRHVAETVRDLANQSGKQTEIAERVAEAMAGVEPTAS